MMNENTFFFSDQITPADGMIEIIDLSAEPYQDQRRVKVNFRLSYFHQPPNASIVLKDDDGEVLVDVDVINIIHTENEITLHIPASHIKEGKYQIEITLFHLEENNVDEQEEGEVKHSTLTLASRSTTFTIQ